MEDKGKGRHYKKIKRKKNWFQTGHTGYINERVGVEKFREASSGTQGLDCGTKTRSSEKKVGNKMRIVHQEKSEEMWNFAFEAHSALKKCKKK